MHVKGVNLGNWLVLEKWMSPGLFEGTTAEDEFYLPTQLPKDVYEARMKTHRAEYITERDFLYIKSLGLDAVRIPVPYFIFGDREPFIGCVEELDNAFAWAERYGLKVLIDLHTTPGSQNGFDNGGISGICMWSHMPEEVEFVKNVLVKLAERYGHREGLWGIEVVNEPILEDMWDAMGVQQRYTPVNKEWAAATKPNTREFIRNFYLEMYDKLTPLMKEDAYYVIHDAFELKAWKDFMREEKYKNVVLDTHQYLMMAEMFGCEHSIEGYEKYIKEHYEKDMEEMQKYFDVVCGEWCLFNSLAVGRDTRGGQTVLNDVEFEEVQTVSDEEKKVIYQALNKAQIAAWNKGSGYFYWSYKLLIDTVNSDDWKGWDAWDLGRAAAFGWFEDKE